MAQTREQLLDATFPTQAKAFKFAYHCVRVGRAHDPLYRTKVTKVNGKWRVKKIESVKK